MGHPRLPLEVRFLAKVKKTDTCWLWTAGTNGNGYGMIKANKIKTYAHRVSYELYKGKIPAGLTIDHLCRVKLCVNPDHLEAVTSDENNRRSPFTVTSINRAKTHCKNGHEFNENNTRLSKQNKRTCIICYRKWDSNRYYTKRRKLKNEHQRS